MGHWWQVAGAFLTGSSGMALVKLVALQRSARRMEVMQSARDQSLDRQRLFSEATDLIDGMRREIDRLRRDVALVRAECESRQCRMQEQVEGMHREVVYWQQVAGELRRDNAQLKAEVGRLQSRVHELEQSNDSHG